MPIRTISVIRVLMFYPCSSVTSVSSVFQSFIRVPIVLISVHPPKNRGRLSYLPKNRDKMCHLCSISYLCPSVTSVSSVFQSFISVPTVYPCSEINTLPHVSYSLRNSQLPKISFHPILWKCPCQKLPTSLLLPQGFSYSSPTVRCLPEQQILNT